MRLQSWHFPTIVDSLANFFKLGRVFVKKLQILQVSKLVRPAQTKFPDEKNKLYEGEYAMMKPAKGIHLVSIQLVASTHLALVLRKSDMIA